MFGKKKNDLVGDWGKQVQKILEQSVAITSANILGIEDLEDTGRSKLVSEIQNLVKETAELIQENCEHQFEKSLVNKLDRSPFGSYSYTKSTSIPKESLFEIIDERLREHNLIKTPTGTPLKKEK